MRYLAAELAGAELAPIPIIPTPFEIWLDRPLETRTDKTEMKRSGFYVGLEVCRLLGTELLKPQVGAEDDEEERRALASGFEVFGRGGGDRNCARTAR